MRPIEKWIMRGVVVALSVLAWSGARAQVAAPPPLVINVRVVDTAGLPVSGADAAVIRGLSDTRAIGTTGSDGRVALSVAARDSDYQLVVRKIGYVRADQFFRDGPGPLSITITMRRPVQTLEAVQVTAEEDIKRKSYFVDADEIAKHADILLDASDILKKLKPDMICGRSCSPAQAAGASTQATVRKCPTLAFSPVRRCPVDDTPPSLATNVWVNGQRILTIATDTVCQVGRRGLLAGLLPGTMQVLCEIQPEHIAQLTFVDEFDNTVGKNGSNDALFIVLKPGIVYKPGKHSFVAEQPAPRKMAASDSSTTLPSFRYRLLGVFDDSTGEPIAGARVLEVNTGTFVTTDTTGTISLVFLPVGGSLVRIIRQGYTDLDIVVEIGPTQNTPLTLLMQRRAQHSPCGGERAPFGL